MAKAKSKPRSNSSRINAQVDKDSSVTVRQIKNGFIVSESGSKGRGRNKEWYSEEWFSKTNPVKISAASGNGSNGGRVRFGNKK